MNDNINTLDGDAELRLAIMSSIAQEESRKTSERVKWGQKRQMEQGRCVRQKYVGLRCRWRQNDYQRGRRKGCTPYLP